MSRILVTGPVGFIGFPLGLRLPKEGHEVRGLDNLDDCNDVASPQVCRLVPGAFLGIGVHDGI